MEKNTTSVMKSFQKCFLFYLLGLMLSFSFEAKAAWTQESVTMSVGETKTLYLPSSVTSLNLKSVAFYSASIEYVEVLSYTNYSVRVKAKKAISTPVIVRCDYYYYYNNNGYTYQYSGAHDFKITVTGSGGNGGGSSGSGPTSLYVTPTTMTLKVGEEASITATQAGAIGGTYFTTDDSSIADVSSGQITGTFNTQTVATITAVGPGTVYVWAKNVNGIKAKCIVTVEQQSLPSVFTYNGVKYNTNSDGTTVSVGYQSGNLTGNVNIPGMVVCNGRSLTVTSISDDAFFNCKNLKSLSLPNTVKKIGKYAFSMCISLTSFTIPTSVTTIGDYAFDCCSGLTSFTIPSSVKAIGDNILNCCNGINSIIVDGGNTKYDSRNNCNAIIETSTNALLSGCKNTIIPNNVEAIKNNAFMCCRGLKTVEIPNSVKIIESNSFSGCTGLTSIVCEIENLAELAMGYSVFNSVDKETCRLIVPVGTIEEYRNSAQWQDFVNIEEETSAISSINVDKPTVKIAAGHISVEGATCVQVYNMNGVQVRNSNEAYVAPGVYIVVADGKTIKVLVR